MAMTLCATQRVSAFVELAHTKVATAARKISTYMPAAATMIRCHLSLNLQAEVTSTYGTGTKSSKNTPACETDPPSLRQAIACAASCTTFRTSQATTNSHQFSPLKTT